MPDEKAPLTKIDTIVLGGSAGAFGVLKQSLAKLPPSLDAAVFVVLHTDPMSDIPTHELLGRNCPLPVREAADGQPIEPGTVTLAPRDAHLFLGENHVHVRRGPKENGFRPAIDPLLRSAAVYRGASAAGFILSGLLDDGASGLFAMKNAGGTCFVQDPTDADYPDMPANALALVPDATPINRDRLAAEMEAVSGTPVPASCHVDPATVSELRIASLESATMEEADKLGTLAPYNCPDCNGVLWEIDEGGKKRYRCHTGHAYSEASLDRAQEEALDRRLFDALRAHRGRAQMLSRMRDRTANEGVRRRLKARAESFEEDARSLEEIIKRRRNA